MFAVIKVTLALEVSKVTRSALLSFAVFFSNIIPIYYGRTLSDASMLYFADVFSSFFMAALVGQTAERIFTKLSHVVDIRCYLRTY